MSGTGRASRVNGCACGQRRQRDSTHNSSNYSILSPVMITVSHSLSLSSSISPSLCLSSTDTLLFGCIISQISKQATYECVCDESHLPESSITVFGLRKHFSFLSALLKLDLHLIFG